MLLIQRNQGAYGAIASYHDRGVPHGSVSVADPVVESVEEFVEESVSQSLCTPLEVYHFYLLGSLGSSPLVHAG